MSTEGSEAIETSDGSSLHRTFTLSEYRTEVGEIIREAKQNGARALLRGECAGGKSYQSMKIAGEVSGPDSYFMHRTDLYDQSKKWADKFRGSGIVIKTAERHCPCFDKGHPKHSKIACTLKGLGYSGTEIHGSLELDCENACDYMEQQADFDPDYYDVIIGHYKHAYRSTLTDGRFSFVDEFPEEAFEKKFTNHSEHINNFLQTHEEILYEDYSDLKDNRKIVSSDRLEKVNNLDEWIESNGPSVDIETISKTHPELRYHRNTPYLAYVIQNLVDLGNKFEIPFWQARGESCPLSTGRKAVFRRGEGTEALFLHSSPDLDGANGILGLDATPTPAMWNLVLGENLDYRSVLKNDIERENYFRDTLGITVKQTNDGQKSYNGGSISCPRDAGILYGAELKHGEKPGVIATKNALEGDYADEGVLDYASDSLNHAKVKSSNDFEKKRLGAVMCSSHPGYGPIKKWGAYLGRTIEPEDGDYGELGNRIKSHFLEHQVEQAICRFGRSEDIEETTVFVNTGVMSDYIPLSGKIPSEKENDGVRFNTEHKRAIADCLRAAENGVTKSEILEKVECSDDTIDRCLDEFRNLDIVESEQSNDWPYAKVHKWTM